MKKIKVLVPFKEVTHGTVLVECTREEFAQTEDFHEIVSDRFFDGSNVSYHKSEEEFFMERSTVEAEEEEGKVNE